MEVGEWSFGGGGGSGGQRIDRNIIVRKDVA